MSVPDCHHVAIDFLPETETLDTQVVYLPVPKFVSRPLAGNDHQYEVLGNFALPACAGLVVVIVSFVLIFG